MITGGNCGATFMLPDTCVLKQTELIEVLKKCKEIDKRPRGPIGGTYEIRANSYPVRYFALKHCIGCEVGERLYKESLTKEKPMGPETKTCPCGNIITRFEKQGGTSWRRVKYCTECQGLSQYQRDKKIKRIRQKQGEKKVITMTPKKAETFVCKKCGEPKPLTTEFFHINGTHNTGYDSMCKLCRNQQKKVSRGTAETALSINFVDYPELLDQIREYAEGRERTPEAQVRWWLRTGKLMEESQ